MSKKNAQRLDNHLNTTIVWSLNMYLEHEVICYFQVLFWLIFLIS